MSISAVFSTATLLALKEPKLSDRLKIVRIFIGSPGGLDEERRAAHEVVNSVNRSHSEHWGLHFKLLGWENAVPGYVRPQSKINEDLDRCDYFIGVLWNRWGSRPSTDTDGYTSGFEEEYNRAKIRIDGDLMKDMAIYFKSVDVPAGMEPGEEIRKVLCFRQKCIDEKKVFFKIFDGVGDFKDLVREKLEEIGWKDKEANLLQEQGDSGQKNRTSEKQVSPAPARDSWLLDSQARDFLNELSQKSPEWDRTLAVEVARLRLIGTALHRSGNDEFYLGNHDANLIFRVFRNSNLSRQEVVALVECGVVGFQQQNVPLWRWLTKGIPGEIEWSRVETLAAIGSDTAKKQAIKILSLASRSIPTVSGLLDKKQVLMIWLSDTTDIQVFDAAVSFLTFSGTEDDVSTIAEVVGEIAPHRRARVEAAVVGILSRKSLDAALKHLVEREVDRIEPKLEYKLFGSPQSLTTQTILSCLSAKSDSIRLRSVRVLFQRGEIALDLAQTLLTDSSYEIRLLAAESLKRLGQELTDDVAKKALRIIKPAKSLFGLLGSEADDTYYDRYLTNRLAELEFRSLMERSESAGIFEDRETSVLYAKYPRKLLDEIRRNLRDCFGDRFNSRVSKARADGVIDADSEARIRKLEKFQRKRLCAGALAALASIQDSRDIDLMRDVISNIEVDATEILLSYFAKYGNWSDIDRVNKLGDYPDDRIGLLTIDRTKLPEQKARAILALGKGRIADIFSLELNGAVRINIAKLLSPTILSNLADEVLLRELSNEEDQYRIIISLRCIQVLSKSRLSNLMDAYVDSNDHRYYNCIHWLDLGVALPTQAAKSIAKNMLDQMQ